MNPKQTLDKLNEGCGKNFNIEDVLSDVCGDTITKGKIDLCPECKRAKNQFIEDCKNELERWSRYVDFLDVSTEDSEKTGEIKIKLIQEGYDYIDELKEVINTEDAE